MTKLKKNLTRLFAIILVTAMSLTLFGKLPETQKAVANYLPQSAITKLNAKIDNDIENYFDSDVIYQLPSTVSSNEEISVIVQMNVDPIIDAFSAQDKVDTVGEYMNTKEGKNILKNIDAKRKSLYKVLKKSGIDYSLGQVYETLISGFEVTLKAKDFDKLNNVLSPYATLIVGEVYEECVTEKVENIVDVYETGIFDSSACEYQGDGVVVAVLDTGLDYTHTAFSTQNFTTSNAKMTLSSVADIIDETTASQLSPGLTAEDVYVSRKVPFAYDYGDQDSDVLPINSEHGTHVAGVIAGKDDTITGVAPNAQLAIMKVFSDTRTGARTSALIAALEDCVALGVDVINMSLGTSCGFSREVDKENVNVIYDKIHEQGISLICAASNDYNSTFRSDKNGSNPLTRNPDSGTVGSPSTYEGALSVASVDGVKTPYLVFGDEIIYFNEASTNNADQKKHFVDDILKTVGNVDSYDFTYVTIPGIGDSTDYLEDPSFYAGKIVLVKRGTSTFEDKVRIALKEKGAAGIIIYNNVSGTISMSVGADMGAVCSISQDEGEKLAKQGTGTLKISRSNGAGPFMSDFSSWGPTSDLKIKPEITAHGGEILSAVPGQGYERLSGTSMAAPNQAGATALIRQYVIYSGVFGTDLSAKEVNSLVNQLMMSTADIVMNKNGLPYAVRKQGSGLVNITKAYTTASYITTFDKDGNKMDKTKLELGDDKARTGVYQMTFDITNITSNQVAYDIDAIMLTEGVSTTYTGHDDTTCTQDGYLLSGTKVTVKSVTGGSQEGNKVSIDKNSTAKVTVEVVLSEEDKQYISDSFEYGMYVEGFIKLNPTKGTTVNMNVPVLAFYGDWTEAPIFDEEYYDTNKDELNQGLDDNEKLMPDAYATRVIGGLYSDYIATLGSYYFVQNPSSSKISATKDHIALSNQSSESNWTISSIRDVYAGLLRNAKEVDITITEDSTGRVVFEKTDYNQYKSHGVSTVYASSIEVEFSVLENNLKNNTKYTVTVETYIDYGEKEDQNNVRNVFEFPLYIDFEAPIVENVTYRTEVVTEKNVKKTHLYADIQVYDNHYAMGMQIGQITPAEPGSEYTFSMSSFGKYVTPIYSQYNSSTVVSVELTDYISQIKQSAGLRYKEDGTSEIVYNNNSYVVTCYDYAMNSATYELKLPDEILSMYFTEDTIYLSPNETKNISTILNIYPDQSWMQVLDFDIPQEDQGIATVVGETIIAKQSGETVLTATGHDDNGNTVTAKLNIKVLAEGDEGYTGGYTLQPVNTFKLTGYKVNKAYYGLSSDDREIGFTDGTYDFDGNYTLSMFPSESVTLNYLLESYFPEATNVTFRVGNSKVATVDENGTITALLKGTTTVTASVTYEGKSTSFSQRVSITVKDPYNISAIYLYNYKGLGGEVEIPANRGITTIYDYAFSNYEYVEKDENDEISDEDPYLIKQQYIGEDTITKVIIPEGVTDINSYAFAGLTALEEVVLPSTLTRIGVSAFYGCTKLSKINLENVKFINEKAFYGCDLSQIDLSSVVSIGNYTFEDCKLTYVELPKTSQSLGEGAFYNNDQLVSVRFEAKKIKIASYAFAECDNLQSIDINAVVISSYAFQNCAKLQDVTLGKDVSVIGEYAFDGTNVSKFKLDGLNTELSLGEADALIYKGDELLLVAPKYGSVGTTVTVTATTIATGAFCGNVKISSVVANNVTKVSNYAFAGCTSLTSISLASATEIGDYAFCGCVSLESTPDLTNVRKIGKFAFAQTRVKNVVISDNTEVLDYAFYYAPMLETVTIGNNVTIGEGGFTCPYYKLTFENYPYESTLNNYYTSYTYTVYDDDGNIATASDGNPAQYTYFKYNAETGTISKLNKVVLGNNVTVGEFAFAGAGMLETLEMGEGIEIGDYAFFNATKLETVNFDGVKSIGNYAFSGQRIFDYWKYKGQWNYAYDMQYINGEVLFLDRLYSSLAPQIKVVDLTNVQYVGEGAFAFNGSLETVIFNPETVAISNYLFAFCSSLKDITLPNTVKEVGDYAFYRASVKELDLSGVDKIGSYAFGRTKLTKVILSANGTEIADGGFINALTLAQAENLDKATVIGAYAFLNTLITDGNLESAVEIGDFAFQNTKITKVTLGDGLKTLGENPFYNCDITSFAKDKQVLFGNVTITESVDTYDIGQNIKVVNGVLYQKVPNGLELVSFPKLISGNYVVEEDTVRISAKAFANSNIASVTLPSTLKSIGHMAFYKCDKLISVTFTSYYAPILEEEYDTTHITYDNLPITGQLGNYEGIGISSYYMWNLTSKYNNFYFGANFVDYIGHVNQNLTLIKPVNGKNYDTFIMGQYFNNVASGQLAITDQTKAVIALINALPKANITLSDEGQIVEARKAYDQIASLEQKSLVTNYEDLTSAEFKLEVIKSQIQTPPTDGDKEQATSKVVVTPIAAVLIGIAGLIVGAGVMVLVYFLLKKKSQTTNNG